MRAVVQRVARARVTVGERATGQIDRGILAFVGVTNDDGPADVQYIAGKIRDLRVFDAPDGSEPGGRMNYSVVDVGGAVLVVSQFTLYADCRKGRRPSLDGAAPAAQARALYEDVVRELRGSGLRVETGEFQGDMKVELVNDGPVTMLLDSRKQF
jgi:D-tyrosyl-tRNA(Tyr) deacylase